MIKTIKKTRSEADAVKILSYLEKSKGIFFKNNFSTRKKLGMNFAKINTGTKILQQNGVLKKHGCFYTVSREKVDVLLKTGVADEGQRAFL